MYNIHPTDFLIFSFDREAFQSKVLFQRPPANRQPFILGIFFIAYSCVPCVLFGGVPVLFGELPI